MPSAGFIGLTTACHTKHSRKIGAFSVTLTGLKGGIAEEGTQLSYKQNSTGTPNAQRWQTSSDSAYWSDIFDATAALEKINITGARHTDAYYIRVGVTIDGVERFSNLARILYAAPVAIQALQDQSLLIGTGIQTYDVSGNFAGEDMVFSINTVAGLNINSSTGVISFDTDQMVEQNGSSVVVTATNSGGSVADLFTLDVISVSQEWSFTGSTISILPSASTWAFTGSTIDILGAN